jgi:hypothetical protein
MKLWSNFPSNVVSATNSSNTGHLLGRLASNISIAYHQVLVMAAHQFRDLPQIPQAMDDTRYSAWQVIESYNYMNTYKQEDVNFRLDDDMYFEEFDNGAVSMQPMERFMHDQYPLAPGLLHANIPIDRQLRLQYEPQWPSTNFYRNVSPDRTSASGTSSYDLHSPHMHHADPYGSPTDGYSPSSLPYRTVEDLKEGGYAFFPSLLGGNIANISLRDIEIEHRAPEPEAAIEDIEGVSLKQEAVCDHETIVVKTETTPLYDSKDDADSGIGNSVRDAESVQPMDVQEIPEDPASDSDYTPKSDRSTKRRRSSASNSSPNRVVKRRGSSASKSSTSGKASKKSRRISNAVKKHIEVDEDRRPFPCALTHYGCTSTFSSKNEWKRHVSTQHIKLSFWRCDLCPVSTDAKDDHTVYYNDFNRKDLFTQHLRRMHAAPKEASARTQKEYPVTEDNLADHQDRCIRRLRKAPQMSGCLFCDKTFDGPTSWEERMEHIGHHLENHAVSNIDLLNTKIWKTDNTLEHYLVEEGLIVREHGGWKIGNGKPVRLHYDSDEDSDED